jgi:hypothetical protein
MANEFHQLPNPTSEPMASSTGYKRQNILTYAIMMGLDTTAPYVDGNNIIIPAGGIVDFNGVLYALSDTVSLAISDTEKSWFIALTPGSNGNNVTPVLTDDPGQFIPSKNGRYLDTGDRVLEWFYPGDPSGEPDEELLIEYIGAITTNVTLRRGFYKVIMHGSIGGNSYGSNTYPPSRGNKCSFILRVKNAGIYNIIVGDKGKNATVSTNGLGGKGYGISESGSRILSSVVSGSNTYSGKGGINYPTDSGVGVRGGTGGFGGSYGGGAGGGTGIINLLEFYNIKYLESDSDEGYIRIYKIT